MYIIKIKGTSKIPDYVQLRDEQYTLLAYFRADRPEKELKKAGLEEKIPQIKALLEELPFGKMKKLEL